MRKSVPRHLACRRLPALLSIAALSALAACGNDSSAPAPLVPDAEFQTISPVGPIEYEGKTLEPQCMDGSPYHFFVKRGSVNKLLMYYQGGGACWNDASCYGVGTCSRTAEANDNPALTTTGFGDYSNPDNPFHDWNIVFVTYCSCD
ncbi:MAG: pectin acetylesterase-family hydrolase, partial [Alphaproteobacteria bacterium]